MAPATPQSQQKVLGICVLVFLIRVFIAWRKGRVSKQTPALSPGLAHKSTFAL